MGGWLTAVHFTVNRANLEEQVSYSTCCVLWLRCLLWNLLFHKIYEKMGATYSEINLFLNLYNILKIVAPEKS